MKFNLYFAIFGFLAILMINYCQASGFSSAVNGGIKELSKVQKKLTNLITKHNREIIEVEETIEQSDVHLDSDILDWVQLGIGIASIVIPSPAGLIIGVSSTLFFTFYEKYNPKEEMTNNYEDNKDNELEFLQDELINIENKIDEITQFYDNETYRAIDGLSDLITKQEPQKEVRTELQFLNYFYKNYYKNCILLINYPYCSQQKLIIDILNQPEPFNYNLDKFVRKYLIIDNTINGYNEKSFFKILLDEYKQKVYKGEMCDVYFPSKQAIYEILIYILTSFSKIDAMVVSANLMRLKKSTDKRGELLTIAQDIVKYNIRSANIIKSSLIALDSTSTELQRCDLGVDHVKGQSWDKFNLLFPIFLGCPNSNQQLSDPVITAMNSKHIWIFSVDKCKEIPNSRYICTYHPNNINPDRPLMHHAELTFVNDTVKLFGQNTSDWNFSEGNHCRGGRPVSLCEISLKNDIVKNYEVRHVSLAPVTATIGHVVTGIRWKFLNRMLYLQIQQGQYINGSVSNPQWKAILEHEKSASSMAIARGQALGFGLADVKLPDGFFVTGVQFDWTNDEINKNKLFRIKVQGKTFKKDPKPNENASKVLWETTDWANFTQKIIIEEPDRPEFADVNTVLSEHGDYIHFQQTDLTKDAAQTSVPYLDIQDVEIIPPRPLGGIGIYYKGQEGYGGFIALRAFVPDYAKALSKNIMNNFIQTSKLISQKIKGEKNNINVNVTEFIRSLNF